MKILNYLLSALTLLFLSHQNIHATECAYVTNSSGSVSIMDTTTNTVTGSISTRPGTTPEGIAVSPDGTKAYVMDQMTNEFMIIDVATNTVSTTVPLGPGSLPVQVAISPDGAIAYITQQLLNSVRVIDVATDTPIAAIALISTPSHRYTCHT